MCMKELRLLIGRTVASTWRAARQVASRVHFRRFNRPLVQSRFLLTGCIITHHLTRISFRNTTEWSSKIYKWNELGKSQSWRHENQALERLSLQGWVLNDKDDVGLLDTETISADRGPYVVKYPKKVSLNAFLF